MINLKPGKQARTKAGILARFPVQRLPIYQETVTYLLNLLKDDLS